VVSYIFAIAVLNLSLGFAVAVHLARRHRQLLSPAVAFQMPVAKPPPSTAGSTPTVEPAPEPAPPAAAAAPAQESEREKTPSERSIEDLQSQIDQYKTQVCSVDAALRAYADEPDADAIKSCLDTLQDVNKEYLGRRDESHEAFEQLHADSEGLGGIRDSLQTAIQNQTQRIDRTDRAVEDFDFGEEADLAEGCRRMVSETSGLLDANDHLHDALDEAKVAAARSGDWLESLDPSAGEDPLTGLLNRMGLEAWMVDWRKKDPHQARQLSVAMIDIDQFGRINEQYGREMGDVVLREFAALLRTDAREDEEDEIVARVGGQRFLYVFPDQDIRFTTDTIERLRQTIELIHFRREDVDIQLTASCAIVEPVAGETSETLLAMAEATILEAKRYGSNRTFLHDGQNPTPVVPPNFTLKERTITL
jgi:diguanylate cyclase (GGDEF)-like protein